jgi:hypothetical protein
MRCLCLLLLVAGAAAAAAEQYGLVAPDGGGLASQAAVDVAAVLEDPPAGAQTSWAHCDSDCNPVPRWERDYAAAVCIGEVGEPGGGV